MTDMDPTTLNRALDGLPVRFPGPGGVAGVVKDGRIVAARAWGYADLDNAIQMGVTARLPICSISKQFTCQVLLAEFDDPGRLDDRIGQYLPDFAEPLPTTRQLCDNQSGLRDYWALTVLHGAKAEQPFRRADALPLIARMRTGHFAPGSEYSYCNANFRILSELIETETDTPLETLYRRHIWDPAEMATAVLSPDTGQTVDQVIGYEGNAAVGHFPARNGIYWIGDAGIVASLNDMLAYEIWIDRTRDDAQSLYRRAATQPFFADGTPALYGYGLARETIAGLDFTGHGGALRGFRAHRLNSREARLSVVVIFNHEADAHGAAIALAEAALGRDEAPAPAITGRWTGQWLAPNGLLARVQQHRQTAYLRYATGPDALHQSDADRLSGPAVTLDHDDDHLIMTRAKDNSRMVLAPLATVDTADPARIAGRYASDETGAEIEIMAGDGGCYCRFHGMLGSGAVERMAPVGPDVWTVATRRSMDAPAPGDWTAVFQSDADGRVTGLRLGCWLARDISYRRVQPT
ncbi:D-aminopeptidase [Paracoccus pacificus]|uniref:D-aminopeptidase n=1 Tax=Paracoccus pacificus TaxID=1463598 RepID=A0ABW4R5Q3_9RHOB